MSADLIQANYEQLERIAGRFDQQVGLTQAEAARAIRRAYGADRLLRLQEIRIIGDGFEITAPRINP